MIREKSCARCSNLFRKNPRFSAAQWGATLYCSQKCCGEAAGIRNAARRPSLRAAFEAKFKKTDGCWEWQGTIEGYGYGVLDHGRQRYRAHVLALEFDGRPVSDGMVACHHCDNRKCVRPDHLYAGTQKKNCEDAVSRDRNCKGERHGCARLTAADVQAMRSMTHLSFTEIAQRFGVSRPTATRAIKGQSWSHVP